MIPACPTLSLLGSAAAVARLFVKLFIIFRLANLLKCFFLMHSTKLQQLKLHQIAAKKLCNDCAVKNDSRHSQTPVGEGGTIRSRISSLRIPSKCILSIYLYPYKLCVQGSSTYIIYSRREGTLGCLLHQSPTFYNNVFLFVGLTTLGTFIEF